jgi:hypothetical protein
MIRYYRGHRDRFHGEDGLAESLRGLRIQPIYGGPCLLQVVRGR